MVLGTLRSVFASVELWRTQSRDLLLVCSNESMPLMAGELRSRMNDPVLRSALQVAWQVTDLEGFLARFVARGEFIDHLIQVAQLPINTDDHNRLEFGFAKTVGRRAGFSVGELRAAAAKETLHLPRIAASEVDWNQVVLNRVVMYARYNEPEVEQQAPSSAASVARGLTLFGSSDFAAARKELEAASADVKLPDIVQLTLLMCRAELGDSNVHDDVKVLETVWPVEAAAIRTVFASRQSPIEGDRAYEHLHNLMIATPWHITPIIERALAVEYASALAEPGRARWLYDLLAKSYCGHRFEEERKAERFRLAMLLGPQAIAESLIPYEPYVPWDEQVLTTRAEAYSELGHPMAKRAAAEWKQFQRMARGR
jgi:hypothetical protein